MVVQQVVLLPYSYRFSPLQSEYSYACYFHVRMGFIWIFLFPPAFQKPDYLGLKWPLKMNEWMNNMFFNRTMFSTLLHILALHAVGPICGAPAWGWVVLEHAWGVLFCEWGCLGGGTGLHIAGTILCWVLSARGCWCPELLIKWLWFYIAVCLPPLFTTVCKLKFT